MEVLVGMVGGAAVLSASLAAAWERRIRDARWGGGLVALTPRQVVVIRVLAGVLIASALGGIPAAAVVGGAIVCGPRLIARRRELRAAERAAEQLPDAVAALAAALRAGLSLSRAVRFAADEAQEPLAGSLRAVGEHEALGVPLRDAMQTWSRELGGAEARLLAGVLDLHRRTGGDFAMVLDRLTRTLRSRRAIRREVMALTAQARLSGTILGLLPFGFLAFLSVTAPGDVAAALADPVGLAAMGAGVVMQGIAFVWIRSLLKVAD